MTKKHPKNVGASVKTRLLALSKKRGEDFNLVLIRYGLERLLHRLGRSQYGTTFILKGAMLFAVWSGHPHRATKDLDLLGSGSPDLDRLVRIFRDVLVVPVDDDGLVFDPSSVMAGRIKEDAEYEGVRVTLDVKLDTAKLTLQVDVGFGDAVTPAPTTIEYPSLLGLPASRLLAYPKETVVAEKLQAMVHLGLANSRMKDFFDLWFLAREFSFDGQVLRDAIGATFERRGTPIPIAVPFALTEGFSADKQKRLQWKAFLERSGVAPVAPGLDEVIQAIVPFVLPPLDAVKAGQPFVRSWPPSGPWGEPGTFEAPSTAILGGGDDSWGEEVA